MDEDYLRGSDGYYGDISLLFFFLDIIILAVTVLVVILWKRRRVKSPGWKPKWSKRITRNGYLVLTVLFGALMLAYIGSAIRENHIILTVTEYMTEVAGRYPVDVVLLDSNDDVLGSFSFILSVEAAAGRVGANG